MPCKWEARLFVLLKKTPRGTLRDFFFFLKRWYRSSEWGASDLTHSPLHVQNEADALSRSRLSSVHYWHLSGARPFFAEGCFVLCWLKQSQLGSTQLASTHQMPTVRQLHQPKVSSVSNVCGEGALGKGDATPGWEPCSNHRDWARPNQTDGVRISTPFLLSFPEVGKNIKKKTKHMTSKWWFSDRRPWHIMGGGTGANAFFLLVTAEM